MNLSNINRSGCHTFSEEQLTAIITGKSVTAAVSFAACLVALILMCVLKSWKKFFQRLTMYLTAVATLLSLSYIFQVLPVETNGKEVVPKNTEWGGVCKAIAFFFQYTLWVMLLVICWIITYLLWLTHYSLQGRGWKENVIGCCSLKSLEVAGIGLTLLFPLLFVWAPFVTDNYGVAGAWCWISIPRDQCNESAEPLPGLGYQIGIWYGPSIVIVLLCTVGMAIVIYRMCRLIFKNKRKDYYKVILNVSTLLVYLVFFNLVNCLKVSSRIYFARESLTNHGDTNIHLWLASAITAPGQTLVIPFTFALSQVILHMTRCNSRRMVPTTTAFIVSVEWSEVDPLVIRQEREQETSFQM